MFVVLCTALEVMRERGEEAEGIKPRHIQLVSTHPYTGEYCVLYIYISLDLPSFREAYRRMQNSGKIGHRSDNFFALNSNNAALRPPKDPHSAFLDDEINAFYDRQQQQL